MTSMRLWTFRVIGLFLVTLSMFGGTLAFSPHEAAAQACSKVNQVKVSNGTKFVCTKVGSKLVWKQQRAAVVATAAPRPTTAAPRPVPTLVVEWSACPRAAATSGSLVSGLLCIQYQGQLTWVSRKTLGTPTSFGPCLQPGSSAIVDGEELTCLSDPAGNRWDRAAYGRTYEVAHVACHSNTLPVFFERLDRGSWSVAGIPTRVPRAGCPPGTSGFVANVRLEPVVQVRFRVVAPRYVWYSKIASLGLSSKVTISEADSIDWAFSSASITSTNTVGVGAAAVSKVLLNGYRLISYRAIGSENHLLFSTPASELPFTWGGITRVSLGDRDLVVSGQPANGTIISPGGTFLVTVNRGNFNETPPNLTIEHLGTRDQINFRQSLLVNFTWR